MPRESGFACRRGVRVRGLGRRGRGGRGASVAEDALEGARARLGKRRVGRVRDGLYAQAPDENLSLEVLERDLERGELSLGAGGESCEDIHGLLLGLLVHRRAGGDGDHVGDIRSERAARRVDEEKRLRRHQRVVEREEIGELG